MSDPESRDCFGSFLLYGREAESRIRPYLSSVAGGAAAKLQVVLMRGSGLPEITREGFCSELR